MEYEYQIQLSCQHLTGLAGKIHLLPAECSANFIALVKKFVVK